MSYQSEREGFEFRGTSGEWFGIWIVNLLLSMVTLGIYSAWAKVRTKQYFYQNTYVAGRNFDYHATGGQILMGRLIVVGALVVYSIISSMSQVLGLVLIVGLVAIFPYLIVRSAKFNARNSSWANVRFNFDGENGRAYLVYLLYPILTALTLYTAMPFLTRAMQRYGINGHLLGRQRFSFDSAVGPFYKAFLIAAGLVICGGAIFAVIAAPVLATLNTSEPDAAAAGALALGYIVLIGSFAFAGILYRGLIRNHIYNNTTLGNDEHAMCSTISVGRYAWIAISNAVVTILSLGLMLPWAQVRMHRYLADHTAVDPNGSLDDFVGEIVEDQNAIGDAYSDIEGVDLGLAI